MVSLSDLVGVPLSVTTTSKVWGPCWVSLGVQVKTPLTGSMAAPAGALLPRVKVRVLAGRSGSVAVAVNASGDPSFTAWSPTGSRVGAWLVSVTVTVMVSLSDLVGVPLSVTTTSKVWGPCWVSLGVQVKTPLTGSMAAPAGALRRREKVRVLAGRSGSVAVAVKVRGDPSFTAWLPMGSRVGAGWFR